MDKLRYFWTRCKEFRTLFNDHIEGDFEAFVRSFVNIYSDGTVNATGLLWEVDDVGILYLTDIVPDASASAHFVFWDRRVRGREGLARGMLAYVFETFGIHRITTEVPLYAPPVLKFVERVGFTKEGRKRDAVRFDGKWFDTIFYSVLEGEV